MSKIKKFLYVGGATLGSIFAALVPLVAYAQNNPGNPILNNPILNPAVSANALGTSLSSLAGGTAEALTAITSGVIGQFSFYAGYVISLIAGACIGIEAWLV